LFKPFGQPKLGGTTDAKQSAFVPVGMNAVFFNPHPPSTLRAQCPKKDRSKKGEKMDPMPQPEPQETNLQERAVETLTDNSLPAAQVIEEQKNDAEQNSAPRFIP
jgi:hypothetical protein